jgi:hypothetical protein
VLDFLDMHEILNCYSNTLSLINESNKWHDLSAAIESGYNPSSILLYCSEVWSLFTVIKGNVNVELKYDSFIPNKVQMKYAKYMLGVLHIHL